MIGRWKRRRVDRRRWAAANSLAELGELMALWLEGDLSLRPAYAPGPQDLESEDLGPLLARANRVGFLTDQSQTGEDGTGYDGRRWQQRAAVGGFIWSRDLLNLLTAAAADANLVVLVHDPSDRTTHGSPGVVVTWREGQPYTVFGGYVPARDLDWMWSEIGDRAYERLAAAHQIVVVDPEPGREDLLWNVLDAVLREVRR